MRFIQQKAAKTHAGSLSKFDLVFKGFSVFCAALVLIIVCGMFIELVRSSALSFHHFGLKFFISSEWNPVTQKFGALTSIYGTLVSTVIAMFIAVPLNLVIALFLVELAPPRVSQIIGMAIELLAAIPSIIYGMWGLFVFAPFMADHIQPLLGKVGGNLPLFKGPPMGIGMLTAGQPPCRTTPAAILPGLSPAKSCARPS